MTFLEPLVTITPCHRHAALLDQVPYTVPAVIEDCTDCRVVRS